MYKQLKVFSKIVHIFNDLTDDQISVKSRKEKVHKLVWENLPLNGSQYLTA